ncbi:MAG: sulfite exporter TauE/SafE family protein [Gammaproteobacteria bacterium]
MNDPSVAIALWCGFALALGGFVKGIVGVGVPMIAVPMMSLFIPPHYAAALVVLPVIPANIVQMRAGGPLRERARRFWPLMAALGLGTCAGGWWFVSADPRIVQFVVGLLVCGFVVHRLNNPSFSIPAHLEGRVGLAVGGLTGAIAGMAMLIGPMVVMYMSALRMEREAFVGSIALVYLVSTLIIAVALAGYSQLSAGLIGASVLACAPVFAGMWLGSRIRKRVSQRLFDRLLNALLTAIAATLLARSLA